MNVLLTARSHLIVPQPRTVVGVSRIGITAEAFKQDRPDLLLHGRHVEIQISGNVQLGLDGGQEVVAPQG
jgi:hypothetical protein